MPAIHDRIAESSSAEPRPGTLAAAVLLGGALLLGGGGSPAPLPELLLEWLAITVAAAWLLLPETRRQWRQVPGSVWTLCALAIAVPLVQLVPLPPALWHMLPGREVEIDALALIGREQSWRPWTMSSARTLASLLSLLPPLVLLVIASTLARRSWLQLVLVLVGVGLASLAVGTLQMSAGSDSPVQFYGVTNGNLRGFQANHNATADLLLAAMLGAVLLIRNAALRGWLPDRAGPVLGLSAMAMALFGFATVFTSSRMGIMLMPLALVASLVMLRGWLPRPSRKGLVAGLIGVVLLALAGTAVIRANPALSAIGERFSFDRELRTELWRDGLYVARKHYPAGVGMGNFVPALIADERLEVVRPSLPNRAHNEYVELSVEAGLLGLVCWGAIIVLVLRAAWRAWNLGSRPGRGEVIFAGTVLLLMALHSMVDYPFRSMSLATLGALCAAMLLGLSGQRETGLFGKDRS